MCFRIQHPLIQAHQLEITEYEVEVLECLGQPETLHAVHLGGLLLGDIVDGGRGNICTRSLLDVCEHDPGLLHPLGVSGEAIHDEDGLDGLGSQDVSAIVDHGHTLGDVQAIDKLLDCWLVEGLGIYASRGLEFRGVGLLDGLVPFASGPRTRVWVLFVRLAIVGPAGDVGEDLGPNARLGTVVRPDTAIRQLGRELQLVGAVEDATRKTDHASGEAGQVLSSVSRSELGNVLSLAVLSSFAHGQVGRNDNRRLPRRDGLVEEMLLGDMHEVLIKSSGLLECASHKEILLGKVLIHRVGHGSEGKVLA